jgi:hypothetical protein
MMQRSEAKSCETGAVTPAYRYKLKARVHEAGFETVKQFCESIGATEPEISNIIRGWTVPGRRLQQRLAQGLGITLAELRRLL